jgi:hypothetical protein
MSKVYQNTELTATVLIAAVVLSGGDLIRKISFQFLRRKS